MAQNSIICPNCKTQISIDEVLAHQISEEKEKEYAAKFEEEKTKWEREQKEEMWIKAQAKAAEKAALEKDSELKLLKEENEKRSKELQEARDNELKLRQERNKLEDEKKALELEKQRQLDEERKKIANTLLEEHRLKEAEKDKQISDMKKTIEELQLKASQGSQQTQGEVMELEIEDTLKREFPYDEVIPVAKGVNGADVLQKVRDKNGQLCGVIVWESKRTKAWSEGWVQKLKDDMLKAKGDIAILISITMPEGVKNFGFKDGIYVTNFDSFLNLAVLIRKTLIDQQLVKKSVVGKNDKMEMVYNYFLSSEFRQRVEAIAEAFSNMKQDLDNEKRVFAKMWAKREKEIERVIHNTVTMHGDLQGLMGSELPKIESLEPTALLTEDLGYDK